MTRRSFRLVSEEATPPSTPTKKRSVPTNISESPAAKLKKTQEPKFRPLANISAAVKKTPSVDGRVPAGASILIIQEPWISLILDGKKTFEIRGRFCTKQKERIYLALSGGGGIILGSAMFVRCHGPFSRDEYADASGRHCVAGSALPYGLSTYAWELASPVRFNTPVPYHHKHGVVVWAKM